MLASITPLGERSRRQRWWLTVLALIAGAASAGAGAGGSLAAAAHALPLDATRRLELLLAIAVAALALDVRLLGLRLPTHLRQVDEAWLHRYRGWVYGFGFGAQLGVGVATVVTTAWVYVALAAATLAPTVAEGAAIGAVFGLVRGASLLATAGIGSPAQLAAFHRRFHAAEEGARRAALVAEAAVIVATATML